MLNWEHAKIQLSKCWCRFTPQSFKFFNTHLPVSRTKKYQFSSVINIYHLISSSIPWTKITKFPMKIPSDSWHVSCQENPTNPHEKYQVPPRGAVVQLEVHLHLLAYGHLEPGMVQVSKWKKPGGFWITRIEWDSVYIIIYIYIYWAKYLLVYRVKHQKPGLPMFFLENNLLYLFQTRNLAVIYLENARIYL